MVLTVPAAPSVKLDDKFYKLVDKLEALVEAPPSLRDAKSLTVKGPVLFRKGVVFKGDTLVVNGAHVPLKDACVVLQGTSGVGRAVQMPRKPPTFREGVLLKDTVCQRKLPTGVAHCAPESCSSLRRTTGTRGCVLWAHHACRTRCSSRPASAAIRYLATQASRWCSALAAAAASNNRHSTDPLLMDLVLTWVVVCRVVGAQGAGGRHLQGQRLLPGTRLGASHSALTWPHRCTMLCSWAAAAMQR